MPRALKTDKFFLQNFRKVKGQKLVGTNHYHVEEAVSLQDLLDFLATHNLSPAQVELLGSFMARVKA